MRKIFTADNLVTVAHYRNVLESEGIRTEIRNQNLGGALGEVPFTEVWPQLWVKPLDAQRALEIIDELRSARVDGDAWRCPGCGADNEPQFAACWQCGEADAR